MKLTIIDLEYNHKKGTIRELSLADVDSSFNLNEERTLFIDKQDTNGNIREGKTEEQPFNKLYKYLKFRLLGKNNEVVVIGWDVEQDVTMLLKECANSFVDSIDLKYFDLQKCYMQCFGAREISLSDAITTQGIDGDFKYHSSKHDVRATAKLAEAICKTQNCSLEELVERYSSCSGSAKSYKLEGVTEEKSSNDENDITAGTNSSVDIPVLGFKKNIGPTNKNGVANGVYVYYNPVLDKSYYEKSHPGKVAKLCRSTLSSSVFDNLQHSATENIRRYKKDFWNKKASLKRTQHIVSYDMYSVVDVENDTFKTLASFDKLKKIGKTKNDFSKAVKKYDKEQEIVEFIKSIYSGKDFYSCVIASKKWSYAFKEKNISISFSLPSIKPSTLVKEQGAKILLPRAFMYALKSENELVACDKELAKHAVAKNVLDIKALTNRDDIKLITKDKNGQAYGFIPFNATLTENIWGTSVAIPLLASIPLDISK